MHAVRNLLQPTATASPLRRTVRRKTTIATPSTSRSTRADDATYQASKSSVMGSDVSSRSTDARQQPKSKENETTHRARADRIEDRNRRPTPGIHQQEHHHRKPRASEHHAEQQQQKKAAKRELQAVKDEKHYS